MDTENFEVPTRYLVGTFFLIVDQPVTPAKSGSTTRLFVANRNSPQKHVWRAKIVLLTADGHGTAEIIRATGKAKTVIWRWQERFGEEGVAGLWRDKTRPSRIL